MPAMEEPVILLKKDMSSTAIRTDSLSYDYARGVNTLVNINLHVNRGDIYGFLGPNGSGKTTTLSLVLGLLKNQRGTIEVLGKDLQNHRQEILSKVGSLIESPSLYGHLTAKENLEVYREIYGATKARLQEVLMTVGLSDTGSKTVKQFSLGMRQRLSIALTLLPKPELLILDEPTNGLDPAGILELRSLIKKLNEQEGITFLVSSHILSEVEKIVNQVGIISKGHMRFQGSLEELHRLQQKQSLVQLDTSDNLRAWAVLKQFQAELLEHELVVPYTNIQQVAAINKTLVDNDLDVYNLHPRKQNLETLFMDLTNDSL
ncbi:ABC transporter ATP-binding protein [Cytophagales bacterium WSM2-2]|nr:ABC transporter ATP-binding protein [Cytophagales bacterium WSM2-2]